MQYKVLVIFSISIFFVLLMSYFFRIYIKTKWKKTRNKVKINEIYESFKEDSSFDEFEKIWLKLSEKLDLDAEKIKLEDKLSDLAQLYPFPEMIIDDIEDIFSEYGVNYYKVVKELTILNIMKILLRTQK